MKALISVYKVGSRQTLEVEVPENQRLTLLRAYLKDIDENLDEKIVLYKVVDGKRMVIGRLNPSKLQGLEMGLRLYGKFQLCHSLTTAGTVHFIGVINDEWLDYDYSKSDTEERNEKGKEQSGRRKRNAKKKAEATTSGGDVAASLVRARRR